MSKPVVSSPLRRAFPLVAILLLTACDAPQLLPPDARLPDGSTYSGDIQDGYFHGEGVQEFASGMVYTGQFQEGYWHGHGELESPAGWHYEGEFQKGTMSGQGVIEDDGSRYEGEFRNGEFHGEGRYEAGGSVYIAEFEDGEPVEGKHVTDYGTYEGEFRDWYYHGEGSYAFTGESEDLGSLTGTWEFGEFVDQEEYVAEAPVPEEPALFTETILVEDRRRLNNQIESLAPEQAEAADAYFLAVGGDGTESVFMRDIQVAKTGLQAQFDVENRAIMLLNHREMLEPLNVRRKLLVISACYSGQWIEPLKDEDTLIMTSARADRTSFGCGDDSEMTWFTKAVYQSVGLSLADPDAMFEDINQQIRTWEEEIGMEESNWSYPQSHVGENLRKWLSQMSQTKP